MNHTLKVQTLGVLFVTVLIAAEAVSHRPHDSQQKENPISHLPLMVPPSKSCQAPNLLTRT